MNENFDCIGYLETKLSLTKFAKIYPNVPPSTQLSFSYFYDKIL